MRFKQLGIEDEDDTLQPPMTAQPQARRIPKSPAARPQTGLNSSIGRPSNMRSKLASTKTPRKQGGLAFSTAAAASRAPEPAPEPTPTPDPVDDATPEMPDGRPQIDDNPTFEADSNLDKIGRNAKQLKYGDLSAQVDALVILNEVITTANLEEHKESFRYNAAFLADTISKVMYDVFDKPPEAIPLKFGKYFISIVNKICSLPYVMGELEEHKVQTLVEQLLLKLLTPGLEHLGERGEGQVMF